jgi:hypothetical protein
LAAGSVCDLGKALGHIAYLLRSLLKIRHRASNLLPVVLPGFPNRPIGQTSFAEKQFTRARVMCPELISSPYRREPGPATSP